MGCCSNPFKGFPIAAYFIFGNELCERFNYYGMRAILSLYLMVVLKYSEDSATGIYHTFNVVAFSVPLLAAIAADSFFGKFYVIFVLSLVYAAGSIVLAVGATDMSIALTMTIVGLTLIAIGTGGIKPCVVAFGADQFPDSPDKEKYLSNYFAFFYFAINIGSVISMNVTPILRSDVRTGPCEGKDSCYELAFGLPAALMVFATVIFIAGYSFYNVDRPKQNIFFKFVGCVSSAIGNSIFHRDKSVKKEHFIDHADEKYDAQFRSDVRRVFSIIVLFLPVPMFWALYDQQGSRWTIQANNMEGEIADGSYHIKPDQIQSINPMMILVLVPICQFVIYPICRRCYFLVTPLQRLCVGGMILALSFIVAAILELEVEQSYDLGMADGEAQLKIVNGLDCLMTTTVSVGVDGAQYTKTLEKLEMWQLNHMEVTGIQELNIELSVPPGCVGELTSHKEPDLTIEEKTTNFYFVTRNSKDLFNVQRMQRFKDVSRSPDMKPRIGLMSYNRGKKIIWLKVIPPFGYPINMPVFSNPDRTKEIDFLPVPPAIYEVAIDDTKYIAQHALPGGIYIVLVKDYDPPKVAVILQPNSCHMLWQIPQYFVLSLAEVMFSIAGLEFAYREAPAEMRSLVQSLWLLTTAVGNGIVTIVATSKIFRRQFYEYLFFAGLLFVDMLVFIILCVRYKYASKPEEQTEPTT